MAVSASLHATKSMARGTAARQGTGIFTILPRFNQFVIIQVVQHVKSAVGWVVGLPKIFGGKSAKPHGAYWVKT